MDLQKTPQKLGQELISYLETIDRYFKMDENEETKVLNTVQSLIEAGADVNAKNEDGETPLYLAAQTNHIEIVKLLIEAGADVNAKNEDGKTPLYLAIINGHREIAQSLIEAGADVNVKNEDGKTPLHIVAWRNHTEIAKLLIEAKANLNEKNKNGNTPLHLAAWRDHIEIVKLLIEAGADVNAKNKDGETPLYLAAQTNHIEMVQLLIEAGADVNAKNEDGKTPLHTAAWRDHIEIVKLLIEAGADVNVKNEDGKTPLHTAAWRDHIEIVKLLIQHDFRIDDDVIAEYNNALNNSNDQTIKSILQQEIIARKAVLKIKNDKFPINKLFDLIREDNFNEFKRNFKNLMNEDQTQRAYEILKVHQENNDIRNMIMNSDKDEVIALINRGIKIDRKMDNILFKKRESIFDIILGSNELFISLFSYINEKNFINKQNYKKFERIWKILENVYRLDKELNNNSPEGLKVDKMGYILKGLDELKALGFDKEQIEGIRNQAVFGLVNRYKSSENNTRGVGEFLGEIEVVEEDFQSLGLLV